MRHKQGDSDIAFC